MLGVMRLVMLGQPLGVRWLQSSHVLWPEQSSKISWSLGGKEVFGVCQGGRQSGERAAKKISPIIIQEGAGS